jgi:hypothetical protein
MTRGRQPRVAVREAMHAAMQRGYLVIPLAVDYLAFDFIIHSRRTTSLVRVRRLRNPKYDPKEIRDSCAAEIAELRGIPISHEIDRELWARGPHQGWHRYRIFPAAIEEIVEEDDEEPVGEPEGGISGPIPAQRSGIPERIPPDDRPTQKEESSKLIPPDAPRAPATPDRFPQAPLAGI